MSKNSNAGTPAGGNFPLNNTNEFFPPVSLTVSSAGPFTIVDLLGGINSFTSNGVLITQTNGEHPGFPPTLNAGGAFDHASNFFWVGEQIYSRAGAYGGLLLELPANPASASYFQQNTGGLSLPQAVIIDGAGTQWVSNIYGFSPTYPTLYPANVSAFTATGAVFSPATGFQAGLACGSLGIAIDTAGNVWVADQCSPLLAEYVGAATPVTPLAIGVRDNTVAQRP